MTFRPLPVLSVASLAALAVLIALGVWQLRRADEKRVMIEAYEASVAGNVSDDLFTPFCASRASPYAQRAVMPATLVGNEVRFYGARPEDGAPGWRILRLTPAPDCDCPASGGAQCGDERLLVVEAGFETLNGERSGPSDVVEIEHPAEPGAFTPQNDVQRGEYYRFEPETLAAAFGVSAARIETEAQLSAPPPGLPPGLSAMPPARHIGYALTWFGLAATLVGVYLAYHHRLGRLKLRA